MPDDLEERLAAVETNRERDFDLLTELREDMRSVREAVQDIRLVVAQGRGGLSVAISLIGCAAGASGWALFFFNHH